MYPFIFFTIVGNNSVKARIPPTIVGSHILIVVFVWRQLESAFFGAVTPVAALFDFRKELKMKPETKRLIKKSFLIGCSIGAIISASLLLFFYLNDDYANPNLLSFVIGVFETLIFGILGILCCVAYINAKKNFSSSKEKQIHNTKSKEDAISEGQILSVLSSIGLIISTLITLLSQRFMYTIDSTTVKYNGSTVYSDRNSCSYTIFDCEPITIVLVFSGILLMLISLILFIRRTVKANYKIPGLLINTLTILSMISSVIGVCTCLGGSSDSSSGGGLWGGSSTQVGVSFGTVIALICIILAGIIIIYGVSTIRTRED